MPAVQFGCSLPVFFSFFLLLPHGQKNVSKKHNLGIRNTDAVMFKLYSQLNTATALVIKQKKIFYQP